MVPKLIVKSTCKLPSVCQIPKCDFHSIAHAQLVVNDPQMILDDVLRRANFYRYFPILHALRHQLYDLLLFGA